MGPRTVIHKGIISQGPLKENSGKSFESFTKPSEKRKEKEKRGVERLLGGSQL